MKAGELPPAQPAVRLPLPHAAPWHSTAAARSSRRWSPSRPTARSPAATRLRFIWSGGPAREESPPRSLREHHNDSRRIGRTRTCLRRSGTGTRSWSGRAFSPPRSRPHRPSHRSGGTLIAGSEAEFNGFNPIKVKGMNSNTLAPSLTVMEGLFAYNSQQQIEPRLGLELKEAPDHKSATVTLRQGVTFHDGTPFNADAVVFHFKRILDPQNNISSASMIEPIESVEAVDPYTVKFNLKHPWPALKSAPGPGFGAQPDRIAQGADRRSRRFPAQADRHRPLRLRRMAGRRPRDRVPQQELLGQGASLSRRHRLPHRAGQCHASPKHQVGRDPHGAGEHGPARGRRPQGSTSRSSSMSADRRRDGA